MDNYHFYDEIGRGRYSQVFKGRQKRTVEYVAIKRVDKALKSRVENEVQIMHRLASPHTLHFHRWYETKNNLWLILEYCTGGNLLTLLQQDGRLPEAAIKVFGVDLMTGLQYLHACGVLYCDLKPSNVLVDEFGVLKLADFGLARRIPGFTSDGSPDPTQSSPRKRGTPYYMAPELFLEEGTHSFASELWSLGCMLFELCNGHPPFTSPSLNELIRDILWNTDFRWSVDTSGDFQHLLSRLLVKDPGQRANWLEALTHPFWSATPAPQPVPLPGQPLFESTLPVVTRRLSQTGPGSKPTSSRALSPATTPSPGPALRQPSPQRSKQHDDHHNRPVPTTAGGGGVDILRLSRNVQHNLATDVAGARTSGSGDGGTAGPTEMRTPQDNRALVAGQDVQLPATDIEVDFTEAAASQASAGAASEDDYQPHKPKLAAAAPSSRPGSADEELETPAQRADREASLKQQQHAAIDAAAAAKLEEDASGIDSLSESFNQRVPHSAPRSTQPAPVPVSGTGVGPGGCGLGASLSARPPVGLSSSNNNTVTTSEVDEMWAWEEETAALLPVRDLLVCAADTQVRPIIFNGAIEVIETPTFKSAALPFSPLTPDQVAALPQLELEAFLTVIYKALASRDVTVADKVHMLAYLFPVCRQDAVANIVINSSFAALLTQMIKRFKSTSLRCLVVTLIGVLVRHAMFIVPDAAATPPANPADGPPRPNSWASSPDSLLRVLTDSLRDPQAKLRRRAMAALGELLFYIATQEDAPGASANGSANGSAQWFLPGSTVVAVARCLQEGEDEVVCHYAAKTIENVLAQAAPHHCQRFATQEVALRLLDLASHRRSEALQTTAVAALGHLLRFALTTEADKAETALEDSISGGGGQSSSSVVSTGAGGVRLIGRLFERSTASSTIIGGLADPTSQRLQTGFLNLVNLVFSQESDREGDDGSSGAGHASSPSTRGLLMVQAQLLHPRLLHAVVRAVDRGVAPVMVRAKAILAVRLIAARHPPALVQVLERGLLPKLEKLVSEPEELEAQPYLRQCSLALLTFLARRATETTSVLALELNALSLHQQTSPQRRRSGASRLQAAAAVFPAVVHLVAAPVVNEAIVFGHPQALGGQGSGRADQFLADLSTCLRIVQDPATPWPSFDHSGGKASPGQGANGAGGAKPGVSQSELQRLLVLVLQGLGRHAEVLLTPKLDICARELLPALCLLVVDASGDTRANAVSLLRLTMPVLVHFELMELSASGGSSMTQQEPPSGTVREVLVRQVLPLCATLVGDREPVPQFTLVLLLDVADVWTEFPAVLAASGVLPRVLESAEKMGSAKVTKLARQVAELATGF